MVTEPSPRVRRRWVGGEVWLKVHWFVWSAGGCAGWAVGVGWMVMGMRVSSLAGSQLE